MGMGANENLLYLQQLLSGLISDNLLVDILPEMDQEDPQTDTDKARIEEVRSLIGQATKSLDSTEDPNAYAHTRKVPICWKPAEPIIILMMVGAIFGSIFSFLLSECILLVFGSD